MASYQNNVVNSLNELYGSGKVYVAPYSASPDFASAIDCGAITGLESDEGLKFGSLEDDNTEAREYISDVQATVKFSIAEVLATRIWGAVRSTLDNVVTTAGTLQSGLTQTIKAGATAKGKVVGIEKQNANGSAPTITSIMQGAVELTLNSDYVMIQSNGAWGVSFIDAGDYDSTKDAVITYSVTPAALVETYSGHASELPFCHVWIVTKHGSVPFTSLFYKCTLKSGKKFAFKKDNDSDPRMHIEIELSAKHDDYHVNANGNGYVYKTSHGVVA